MVTLKDIAEEAGCSIMTVSRVINHVASKVSDETRQRIWDIIEARGYIPNSHAQSLSSRASKLVAVLVSGEGNVFRSPYNAIMVGNITNAVQKRGYSVLLCTDVADYQVITRQLTSWKVAGAIFLGLFDSDLNRIREDNQIPLVFTDSYSTVRQLTNVGIDDYRGGELGARFLLENGHREIVFAGHSTDDSPVLRERLRGFTNILKESGIQLPRERVLPDYPTREQIEAVLISPKPTAFFAVSDFIALSIISVLNDLGINVPGDISVIGFDNIEMGQFSNPKLTTIAQDINKKAQIAVDLLFEHIENPAAPAQNVVLDVQLVIRDSVAARKSL